MSTSIFLLWLVSIPLIVPSLSASSPSPVPSQEQPRGFLLSCGSSEPFVHDNLKYAPDKHYVSVGNMTTLEQADLLPQVATLRHFPDKSARKYCYVFPTAKGGKYLVRTTYYYGAFDGGREPPVFDQIVDGTRWSVVNTTEDYAKGAVAYYEIIVAARCKTLSMCLARNAHTHSDPFINVIEVRNLDESLYNATDFTSFMLNTVARDSFGREEEDDEDTIVSYPDDPFNRYWHVFKDDNHVVTSKANVVSSDYWNLPPAKVFKTGITTSRSESLELKWPPVSLPAGNYYIALYFRDNRPPGPYSWTVFDVGINGENFYTGLNATVGGVTVYSSSWPLKGQTGIELTPADDSPVGPVINAGEVLQLVPLGGRTLTRDVIAMEGLARGFENAPPDWRGDPCLPIGNSWTGVVCSTEGEFSRVTTLNLANTGLSGSLSPSIAKLTALNSLMLGDNRLSGKIPEMGTMNELRILHLQNNHFKGAVPQSLGLLPKLQDINLHGNKLYGNIPETLQTASTVANQAYSSV